MRASSLARRRQHVVAFRTLSLSRQYSRGIARSSRALLTPCVASRVGHDKTTVGRECVAAEEESSPSTRERFYSNTFAAVLAVAVGVLPLSSHAVGPVKVTLSDAHIEKIECADFKQGALGQGSKVGTRPRKVERLTHCIEHIGHLFFTSSSIDIQLFPLPFKGLFQSHCPGG